MKQHECNEVDLQLNKKNNLNNLGDNKQKHWKYVVGRKQDNNGIK
jgi:hypothetical protein